MAQFKASLDPSNFKQGVEEIKRASKDASAAVDKIGESTVKAGRNASASVAGFEKFMASIDETVRREQALQRDLEKLERFQKSGVVTMGQYGQAQDAIARKYGDLTGAQVAATRGVDG